MVKNPPGGSGLILGSGRSPGEGTGNPFQYSLPRGFHGQRSQAGSFGSQSDTTE